MYEITMPKLSDSMEVGKIVQWKVKEGDEVHEGDVLAEVESDKATMDLECFHDGVITEIKYGDDKEAPVGEVIGLIRGADEAAQAGARAAAPPASRGRGEAEAAPEPEKAEKPEPAQEPKAEKQKEEKKVPKKAEKSAEKKEPPAQEPPAKEKPEKAPEKGERVAISPYARKLAVKKGVDYTKIKGSGPGGRIVARDIEDAEPSPVMQPRQEAPGKTEPTAAGIESMAEVIAKKYGVDTSSLQGSGYKGRITVDDVLAARGAPKAAPAVKPSADEELPALEVGEDEADVEDASFMLKTQVRRVTASKHVIPHFYMTQRANVTELMKRKDAIKKDYGATLTHLVMRAAVKSLKQHPEANTSYDRGKVIKWKRINLGIAVATEKGLTVAVLKNAQDLGLREIVDATRELVEKARSGKLSAEERSHPTFTISNLGMFGVEDFHPIINPPSAMTLAVPAALPMPVVNGDKVEVGQVMTLTVACDHRIIDGVGAARFIKDLQNHLENADDLLAGD